MLSAPRADSRGCVLRAGARRTFPLLLPLRVTRFSSDDFVREVVTSRDCVARPLRVLFLVVTERDPVVRPELSRETEAIGRLSDDRPDRVFPYPRVVPDERTFPNVRVDP